MASRTYAHATDPKKTLVVEIGQPRAHAEGDYYCTYRIVTSEREINHYAAGIDSVQALELAIQIVGVELDLINQTEFEGMLQTLEGKGPELHWSKIAR